MYKSVSRRREPKGRLRREARKKLLRGKWFYDFTENSQT